MGHRRFQGIGEERERIPRRERGPLLDFATRTSIALTLACLAVAGMWLIYKSIDIWLVTFGGIVMAVLFRTMAEPFMRCTRLPVWAAVIVAFTLTVGLLVLAGWLLAPSISQQFDELSVRLPEAIDRLRARFLSYQWAQWLIEKSDSATDGHKVFQQITHAFQITFTAAGALVIVLFLSLYMAAQPELYRSGIVRLVPITFRRRAREVMDELYRVLRMWLLTKLISMAFVAVCVALGLWLMHVPLPLAFGLLAGLLEFVPTIGPLLSAAPVVLMAFVKSPMTALYVILLYFGVQWVQNHVTNPLLQQRTLSLPPALTLVLVALLGTLFGFGGLLLSGPLSVVVIVLVKMVYVEDVLEKRRVRGPRQFEHEHHYSAPPAEPSA